MSILATELRDFLEEDITSEEAAQDINEVYMVINKTLTLNSQDYRCLVTSERKLVIICFDTSKLGLRNILVKALKDETTLRMYGIEGIYLISPDEGTRYEADTVRQEGEMELMDANSHHTSFSYVQIDTSALHESPPVYIALFQEISSIKNLSLTTIAEIVEKLNVDMQNTEEYTTTIQDKSILLNTIEVFEKDAKECKDIEIFSDELDNLKNYFYPKHSDSESIKHEKKILVTLAYLLESIPFPFQERFLLHYRRKMHIKFYLLLCLAFNAFTSLRKSERTLEMRKNKKRYIEAINKILAGETAKIQSKHIISYIRSENPFFSEEYITEADIKLLKELKLILEYRPEVYSHRVAHVMTEMFGESINVRNRLLRLIGLKGIGHDTKV